MEQILGSLKLHITPEILAKAANLYGESESGISKTIGCLAPTILSGMLNKSGDSTAMGSIFNTIKGFDFGILDNLGSLLGAENLAHNDPKAISGQLLGSIFGEKVPALTNAAASFSGVKQSSASALLGLAGPIVMGLLSKKINANDLSASGFVRYVLGQKGQILSLLPASIGSVLDAANIGGGRDAAEERSSGGMGWFWPLLFLLGLGAGIMYFMKN